MIKTLTSLIPNINNGGSKVEHTEVKTISESSEKKVAITAEQAAKTLTSLTPAINNGGSKAEHIAKVIGQLPIDKSKAEMVGKTLISLMQVYIKEYVAAKNITKLPLDTLNEVQITAALDNLLSLVNKGKRGREAEYKAAEDLRKLSLDKNSEEQVAKAITSMMQNYRTDYAAAYAIGKLPLSKLKTEKAEEAINSLMMLLAKGGNEAERIATKAIYNIALHLSLEKIASILEPHFTHERLPHLVDHIARNISSKTTDEIGNVEQIKILLELSSRAKKSKNLEATISNVLGKVAENVNIKIVKELPTNEILSYSVGKEFLTKIYQRILKEPISQDGIEVIKALTEAGFTISVSKKLSNNTENPESYEIITFNGNKYQLTGKTPEDVQAYITQVVEIICSPCTNIVQFKNSGKFLPQAALDVEDNEVKSIIDNRLCLAQSIIITKINQHNVIYKENRDIYGMHCIAKYKLNNASNVFEKIGEWNEHPKTLSAQKKWYAC